MSSLFSIVRELGGGPCGSSGRDGKLHAQEQGGGLSVRRAKRFPLSPGHVCPGVS